ncbi:hypothetical protein LX64_03375 [Chitinophaga skermanii]|uniref:Alginate lyase n=1 Tax=Chitinophaga skermanii TaxID=331697 RepID=A0A327QGB7_9BACT|nr:hypothetical protein [Chitinophaga skermanii]RAJ02363.1 hypothetical protein LX64_03375 [Chitinophaga skermanii]
MKKMNIAVVALLVLSSFACKKDLKTQDDGAQTVARAALGQSNFNLWKTCNGTPYNITGTNGICIPVGNCSTDINAAQQNGGQTATGLQFYGCFKGGSNAYSSASEQAVFVCDNVSSWTGNEMGFVKTLNDNVLKGYLQGGGQYIYQTISVNDNGYHTFKCQAKSTNTHQVDFYVDGVYKFTLTNNSGSYYGNWFYFVGTNHWYGGSNPTGQQIEMYSMQTF